MHQVDNFFKEQQLGRVNPQPRPDQHAVELPGRERATKHLLGSRLRGEQATFDIIATLLQELELARNEGSNGIRRQGTKMSGVRECWIETNCKHGLFHGPSKPLNKLSKALN